MKANVASVMCSYNKLNTTWACESKEVLTNLLKNELDFQGYVLSGNVYLPWMFFLYSANDAGRLECSAYNCGECQCWIGKEFLYVLENKCPLTSLKDMTMPGDNFGNNVFLWGTALLNAVTSFVSNLSP